MVYRIDDNQNVPALPALPEDNIGTPGYYTGGNAVAGTPATRVRYWWLNMIQEEIATVVAFAGIAFAKANNGQLLQAIQQLFRPLPAGVVFNGSGIWTVPAGIYGVEITLLGGGCGGGRGTTTQSAANGSAGGLTQHFLSVVPGQQYAIIIGAGGVGASVSGNNGGAGGTSTFGLSGGATILTATGASVGATLYIGGVPGVGSGGNIVNVTGGAGSDALSGATNPSGAAGNSMYGGATRSGTGAVAITYTSAPAAGGGSTYGGSPGYGTNGGNGICIIRY